MLKNKRGEGYILTCVLVLVCSMILSVFVMFASAVNVIRTVRMNSITVLDSHVVKRSIDIYSSIKQGHDRTSSLKEDEYIDALTSFCTFERRGNYLYNYDEDGNEQYHISAPVLAYTEDGCLKVSASYDVIVPIYFAGVKITDAVVPVTVESRLSERW